MPIATVATEVILQYLLQFDWFDGAIISLFLAHLKSDRAADFLTKIRFQPA